MTAYGFTAANPKAIDIDQSVLEVGTGKVVSIVAGQDPVVLNVDPGIRMTGAIIRAPEGQINVVGVASTGEINVPICSALCRYICRLSLMCVDVSCNQRKFEKNGQSRAKFMGERLQAPVSDAQILDFLNLEYSSYVN